MEIIHIFPPNNNKYKNLLDMNDEKENNYLSSVHTPVWK